MAHSAVQTIQLIPKDMYILYFERFENHFTF